MKRWGWLAILTGINPPSWWNGVMALLWLVLLIISLIHKNEAGRTFWLVAEAWAFGVQSTLWLHDGSRE